MVLVKNRVGKICPYKENHMETELIRRPSVLAARRWYDVLDFCSLRCMSLNQWMDLRCKSRDGAAGALSGGVFAYFCRCCQK